MFLEEYLENIPKQIGKKKEEGKLEARWNKEERNIGHPKVLSPGINT